MLEKFAGTGRKINDNLPGAPGYKEIVDFKEYIGIWKNEKGVALPTTRGAIHYGKKGAHIISAKPK